MSDDSSSFFSTVEDWYVNDIKPYLCTFGITAVGVYFLTPVLLPSLNRSALGNVLSARTIAALLAGSYAAVSVPLCVKLKTLY
jgi:hypothetical protein